MNRRRLLAEALLLVLACAAIACGDGSDAAEDGAAPVVIAADAASATEDAQTVFAPPPEVALPGPPCNGRSQLCERRYDRVTHLATHGAVTNDDPVWQGWRTQHDTIREQLDRGVRAIMLEAHAGQAGSPALACLSDCTRGSAALARQLSAIKEFLDVNPREIVTLLLDNADVPVVDLVVVLTASGLAELAHAQPSGAPWPTLGAMVASGKRLVILAHDTSSTLADAGPRPDWYNSLAAHARETRRVTTIQELVQCALEPTDAGARPLTLVHGYLVRRDAGDGGGISPAPEGTAAQANAQSTLSSTHAHCTENGTHVTFLAADFFGLADARNFVSAINDADAGR